MASQHDTTILRELARRTADIAAMPVQEQTRALWRKLNARRPDRPMVMIDQVCWNELEGDDELAVRCEDEAFRNYERRLRRVLYQWKHFAADMVVEPFINVPMAITNTGLGIAVQEETAVTDPTNAVVAHKYANQFRCDDDLAKIQTPRITHDPAQTARRLAEAREVFGGLLEVRAGGVEPYLSLWDPIATWMGMENALYAMLDTPDLVHKLLSRVTDAYLAMLDQLEQQGLLCRPQTIVHCTGAYTDELPAAGYDPLRPRTKDLWMYGLAQMLGTVSPEMYEEFEIAYTRRLCERFGLVYYGCCDPLDRKMAQVRMLPNVRKVSMSPWADQQRGAAEIGRDFVFSRKPNPAMLAGNSFCADAVRQDLRTTLKLCCANNCPLEFILKDISTIRYEPQRLFEWEQIAMEVATQA